MPGFQIVVRREPLVESVHRVSVAVVSRDGRLVAESGNPDLVSFWRSAAKPFQAMPLVADGVMERFRLGSEELALACASHSSQAHHLAIADRFLALIGRTEADLACGPHVPLDPAVAHQVVRDRVPLSPRWSNCSGKHSGMLALATHHGWPIAGYERVGHPVQDRLAEVIAEWTGIPVPALILGVDGCTTVCYALSLRAMALAYARLVTSEQPEGARVRAAMMAHPELVGGTGRFDTDLMVAMPGEIVAKIGAEGIYCAGIPSLGVGIALKVEDGDMRSLPPALFGVLEQVLPALDGPRFPTSELAGHSPVAILNTRGRATGELRPEGRLRIHGTP
jgi:L-asparaginase II